MLTMALRLPLGGFPLVLLGADLSRSCVASAAASGSLRGWSCMYLGSRRRS